jgi:uncharacterized membrane protein YhaH (DUF805 family)
MNGQVSWSELFFSANGRATRLPSLIGAGVLLTLAAFYEALVEDLIPRLLTGWLVYPALIYCGACVLSKRLHDRGRTGWWAAVVLFSIVAVWPHPASFLDFPFMLILVWAVVDLGVMAGEQGANRYGPNPLGAPLAA